MNEEGIMVDESDMREALVGYLFGALDERETRDVETVLADTDRGVSLRRDLDILRRAVRPLDHDTEAFAPPPGLADRTLAFVARSTASTAREAGHRGAVVPVDRQDWEVSRGLSPVDGDGIGRPRAWLDRFIIGATALAACVLVAPLLLDAIEESRARRAERRLQRLSGALQGYAEAHRFYPTPPDSGPLSRAGLYAPTLVSEERLIADDGTVLCPDTELSRRGGFRVPSLEEVRAAVGTPRFDELVQTMGGDYGYTLGHRNSAGVLQPNLNQRRAHFPIMADAPDACCEKSSNHPDGIHHVLFEDGHIETLRIDTLHRDDHLYRNDHGKVAAGVEPDDAVIGDSHHQP
jgi:hypothetical protein